MTDSQEYQRLHEIFAAVVEQEPDERAAELDRLCGDDTAVREQVEALLRFHEQEGGLLARPLVASAAPSRAGIGSGATAVVPGPTEQAGDRIGRYRLLQEIGEGGFGVVYMAEQKEPVRRKVALKIIKLGMDTKQVIARFEVERQALAMMDHPNIAKVLDAGTTETGRPYFVMELVKGDPVTEYCDRQNLGTKERLEIFRQICHAVQHAHQKGVIHRDLKPSNVLVTVADGQSIPKVIDFGIAKATNRELTDKTLVTEFRQLIGTPEYMSPEQAEMTGVDIDTRSDIYALGVLLYELLTGTTPFDPVKLRSAAHGEIQRIIREEEPPKPSTRLQSLLTSGQAADGDERSSIQYIAHHRRAEPASLSRLMRGDLDWIVMKCLEKDRTRRYNTANGLANDIQRYLDDEPVSAGPPSTAYRLRKFVRRNRAGVTAAALVALAVLLGAAASTAGFVQASIQRDLAKGNADEATLEAARANAVIDLMKQMLSSADPHEVKGPDFTVRQLLDEFAAGLGDQLKDQPEVEATIQSVIGTTYESLGSFDAAEPHLRRAESLRRRVLGDEHPETLASINKLAGLLRSQGGREAEKDKWNRAESMFLETLEISRRELGAEHPVTVGALKGLALVYADFHRYDEAEPLFVEALAILERTRGKEHATTLWTMGTLAAMRTNAGRSAEAEPLFLETIEIQRRVLGEAHPTTLRTMYGLAVAYGFQRRYDEAERLALKVLQLVDDTIGLDSDTALEFTAILASQYSEQGRYDEAETYYSRMYETAKRVMGRDHTYTYEATKALAAICMIQGRRDEALRYGREVAEILERVRGPGHPITLARRADLLAAEGRDGEAEQAYLRALEIRRRDGGIDDPQTRSLMVDLASFLERGTRLDEALALRRELIEYDVALARESDDANLKNDAAWELLTTEQPSLRDPDTALVLATEANELTGYADGLYLDTLALAHHLTGDAERAAELQRKAIELLDPRQPPGVRTEMQERLAEYEAGAAETDEP